MEDFLDHTYATLFDTEVNRKIKREPALAMEEGRTGKLDFFPAKPLVQEGETEQPAVQMDVVNELWVF
ncbi:hypothetical protein FA13DRAFT_1806178 [Coprinellus micaceus]|uniref:Uncharacterized protein n=1 Tax=Coprinellus micaceus TaxID=71717 RepID=A0A4Y7RQU4_COPMI|nr:hypothetical protein FA13DRAFT_1806178 [Coprinellus micaceus]